MGHIRIRSSNIPTSTPNIHFWDFLRVFAVFVADAADADADADADGGTILGSGQAPLPPRPGMK